MGAYLVQVLFGPHECAAKLRLNRFILFCPTCVEKGVRVMSFNIFTEVQKLTVDTRKIVSLQFQAS